MKNHQKIEVENFDDCDTSSLLLSLEAYRSWAAIVTQLKKYKFGVNMLSSIADCSSFQQQQ